MGCMAYLAAIECPDRGEQTRAEVVQLFEQLDLSVFWGMANVEYFQTTQRDSNGNPIPRLASVHMLSVTYLEQYFTPVSKVSKKSNSGHQRSRRVRGGRVVRGVDASQRWVVKQL